MVALIDPPSSFAPTKQWQDFLARMLALPQNQPQVQAAVKEAREELRLRQGASRPWWREEQQA
jgi:hypothetical protein